MTQPRVVEVRDLFAELSPVKKSKHERADKAIDDPGPVFLSVAAVRQRYGGVSVMWLTRRLENDGFPAPYYTGSGPGAQRFWRITDLQEWENNLPRTAASRPMPRPFRELRAQERERNQSEHLPETKAAPVTARVMAVESEQGCGGREGPLVTGLKGEVR